MLLSAAVTGQLPGAAEWSSESWGSRWFNQFRAMTIFLKVKNDARVRGEVRSLGSQCGAHVCRARRSWETVTYPGRSAHWVPSETEPHSKTLSQKN